MSTVLARAAERLRRLKPDWADPSRFISERDELARTIELEAVGQRRDAVAPNHFRRPEPVPDQHTRRLVALARFQAGEIDRLERLLAHAARARPRRRQAADHRQLVLSF